MKTKFCNGCSRQRKIGFFPFKNKLKKSRHSKCKKCFREYNKQYYVCNKEKHNKQIKLNKIENAEINYANFNQMYMCDCGQSSLKTLLFVNLLDSSHKSIYSLIKSGISTWGIEEIAEKSKVLCANCLAQYK